MRVSCPHCHTIYEVDTSAIPPEGRSVQCSNCQTVWNVTPDEPLLLVPTPAQNETPTPAQNDATEEPQQQNVPVFTHKQEPSSANEDNQLDERMNQLEKMLGKDVSEASEAPQAETTPTEPPSDTTPAQEQTAPKEETEEEPKEEPEKNPQDPPQVTVELNETNPLEYEGSLEEIGMMSVEMEPTVEEEIQAAKAQLEISDIKITELSQKQASVVVPFTRSRDEAEKPQAEPPRPESQKPAPKAPPKVDLEKAKNPDPAPDLSAPDPSKEPPQKAAAETSAQNDQDFVSEAVERLSKKVPHPAEPVIDPLQATTPSSEAARVEHDFKVEDVPPIAPAPKDTPSEDKTHAEPEKTPEEPSKEQVKSESTEPSQEPSPIKESKAAEAETSTTAKESTSEDSAQKETAQKDSTKEETKSEASEQEDKSEKSTKAKSNSEKEPKLSKRENAKKAAAKEVAVMPEVNGSPPSLLKRSGEERQKELQNKKKTRESSRTKKREEATSTEENVIAQTKSSPFWTGFYFLLTLFVILIGTRYLADPIARAVPGLAEYAEGYAHYFDLAMQTINGLFG